MEPVTVPDLLLLIGDQTVQLTVLKKQLADAKQRIAELEAKKD